MRNISTQYHVPLLDGRNESARTNPVIFILYRLDLAITPSEPPLGGQFTSRNHREMAAPALSTNGAEPTRLAINTTKT